MERLLFESRWEEEEEEEDEWKAYFSRVDGRRRRSADFSKTRGEEEEEEEEEEGSAYCSRLTSRKTQV